MGSLNNSNAPNRDNIKRLIQIHARRLQKLEEKKARFGYNTDVHILLEIEDERAEIRKLIHRLEKAEQTRENQTIEPRNPQFEFLQNIPIISTVVDSRIKEQDFSATKPYFYALIAITGAISSTAFISLIVYLLSQDLSSMLFLSIFTVIGGMASAIIVDIQFKMETQPFWKRLPLAVIVGALGGLLGILILILLLFAFAIWALMQESSRNT